MSQKPSPARQQANEVASQARDKFNAGVQAAEAFRRAGQVREFIDQVQQNQVFKAAANQAHQDAVKVSW
jgi:hypothetical protein